MDQKIRQDIINKQRGSHLIGTVEYINDGWIFFDETDEAYELYDLDGVFEIKRNRKWKQFTVIYDGIIQYKENKLDELKNGDMVRVSSSLFPTFEDLLENLDHESFIRLVHSLNQKAYSLFDCIYCHNFMAFQRYIPFSGMNMMIFDNGDLICAVQHFFERSDTDVKDRFEFSFSNGERMIQTRIP